MASRLKKRGGKSLPDDGKRVTARERADAIARSFHRAHGRPPPGSKPSRPRQSKKPEVKDSAAAAAAFSQAKKQIGYGNWQRVKDALLIALEHQPDSVEFSLYSAWADYQLASTDEKRERMRDGLESEARAATRKVREFGFGHYIMGQVRLAKGEHESALKSFAAAARFDPDNLDAVRYLRLLRSRLKK